MIGLLRPSIERLQQVPGRHRPHHARNGAIVAALIGLVLAAGFAREIPFTGSSTTLVRAELAQAPNLRSGHPVRVAGVDVGRVSAIDRNPNGGVVVGMRIEDADVEVKRDATAALRWRTVFGRNMFIDLEPGSPAAPPLGEAMIPSSRTETQVELDQILEPLDHGRRRAARTVVRELDQGLADRGAAARTIDRLAPAMRNLGPTLEGLRGERDGDLGRLVADASEALGTLAAGERRLGELVDGGAVTMAALAARRADLGELLQQAPATLRETRTTMVDLRRTLDRLDPLAAVLRPGMRRLEGTARAAIPALAEAAPLLRAARPLLERLGPTARALRRTANPGRRVLVGLEPTLARTAEEIAPFLDRRGSQGLRNLEALGPFFSAWTASMAQFDAGGHMNRFQVFGGEHLLTTLPCDSFLANPDAEQLLRCEALGDALGALLGGGR